MSDVQTVVDLIDSILNKSNRLEDAILLTKEQLQEMKEQLLPIVEHNAEFFPITHLSKCDILGHFKERNDEETFKKVKDIVKDMDDGDMNWLANKMGDAYTGNGYWIDLEIIFENRFM